MKNTFLNRVLKSLTVFLIVITTTYSCINGGSTKEERWDPELPPITQTGENTFGCKIDGKIMIPRDSRVHSQLGGAPSGVSYGWSTSTVNYDYIEAQDRYTSRGGVAIKIPNIQTLKVGEYQIQSIVGGFASTHPNIVYIQAIHHRGFYGSIEGSGKIIITKYDNDIISGTFYCKLKNRDNSTDIIEVTEGRFDFTKNTINTTRFR